MAKVTDPKGTSTRAKPTRRSSALEPETTAEMVHELGADGLRRARLQSGGKSNRSEETNVGSERER